MQLFSETALTMKTIAYILSAVLLFTGCSSYKSLLDGSNPSGTEYYNSTYRGQTHSQIVMDFGAPNREVSDGGDGIILVYEDVSTSSYVYSTGYVDHDVNVSYIQFFLDGQGVCYNVKTNRLSPAQEQSIRRGFLAGYGVFSGVTLIGGLAILIGMLAH